VRARLTAARAFVWAGAVLFAGALGFFLYAYSVTFGEIREGRTDVRAILVDIALFGVFGLHHSLFARLGVRALVTRFAPANLERSLYVWVASLMLIAVCASWRPVAGVLWDLNGVWGWPLFVVQAAGILLTARATAVIDYRELAGINPQSSFPTLQRPMEFRTDGPYGWVRHPIYLGWVLFVFGVATMTMTRFVFAAVSTLYLLIAIPFEERTLREASAGAYGTYSRQVRWKLLPYLY
jgi:protein-S-isoprenylcysteine O-methyltransferase Ste14